MAKGPVLDAKPEIVKLLRNLGIDNWVQGDPTAADQWIEMDAQIANPVEMLSDTKLLENKVGKRPSLSTFNAQEGFMGYVMVSMVTAFVLASPWIFYQIWSFIAAGLYPHEKRYVNVFLPISIGLFLVGCVLCQFFVIPKALAALLWFNEWLQLEPDFRWNEWLSFAIFMPVVFGLAFQTPLVMLFMERIGIPDGRLLQIQAADRLVCHGSARCVAAAGDGPSKPADAVRADVHAVRDRDLGLRAVAETAGIRHGCVGIR